MEVPIYNSVVNSSTHCEVEFCWPDVDKTSYFLADTEFHYILLL